MAWLYAVVFSLGLVGCELSFGLGWGFTPQDDQLRTIASSGLALSGITVAVVGLLLTLYITRALHNDDKGPAFRNLVILLTAATVAGFSTSMAALAALEGVGGSDLREVIPYGFLGVVYSISVGLAISTIEILRP